MDGDKRSSSRVHVLADEDNLIANPTFKNLARILEHINSVLRDPLCSLIPETVSLVCKLIPIEAHLPCAPFTIDKIMLSLAERSPDQFARIMAVMETRIQNARRSQCAEACEVVLTYSVLNNTWNKECEERLRVVDDRFRKKIAKRRAARLNLEKEDATGPPYEDIFDVAPFFTQDYFLGETCWNPVLSRCPADTNARLFGIKTDSDGLGAAASKVRCRAGRDGKPCPRACIECLLAKYIARAPIEMHEPSRDTSFAEQFLFSYHLICVEEYRRAKDSLKTILLKLKGMETETLRKTKVCSKKPEAMPFDRSEGCGQERAENAENAGMEKHIVAIKLHVYNLISFCHLYLGGYTELCYYIDRAISISNSSAFAQRKSLVDFIAGAGRPPGLDVWIREIEFAGGLYVKCFDAIRNLVLARYICCLGRETHVRSSHRTLEGESQLCGRGVDLFFQRLLRGRFLDRKLVLNILLRNEKSILRELKHEDNISPSIFVKSAADTGCVRKSAGDAKARPCHADGCTVLKESALCTYLLSMVPPETKVFSFYMIEDTLFVNEYPCCRRTTVPRFDAALGALADILEKSKATLKQKVSTRKDAKDWWEKRHELDGRLGSVLAGLSMDIEPSECNALLVDAQLHNFPFEACGVFDGKRVFRIPSLSFLCSSARDAAAVSAAAKHGIRTKIGKGCTDMSCVCGQCPVKSSTSAETCTRALPLSIRTGSGSVFYLLDLLGNLEKSRVRLKPLLSCMPGVAGRLPSAEELQKARTTETLLYFGHGNGSRYLRGSRNRHMGLFGCSSARALWSPNFNIQGAICSYLKSCVFLLGCLWDVTDHDLDEIARGVLERGEIDRSVCRLRYLNGAAVVVYGAW